MNPYGYQNQSQYGPPAPPAYQGPPNSYATQLSTNQPQAWNAQNQHAPHGQSWQQFQAQQPQQQQPQQQPQQQQQNAAPGYNPGTYGAMPGAHQHTQSSAPAVPQYNAPQYSNTAPPPPPKPPGFNQPNPQQPQGTYYQGQANQQTQPTYASPPIPQPYNNTAPPPPQTPGGSYFPPSGTPNPNSYGTPQGGVTSPITQPPMSAGGISAQNPAYIPPSLSGQGVASYMPSNTNPLPGVYVPPPPDVPAWTQASQLAPKNKFKYTPAVVHPSYQTNTQGYSQQPAPGQALQYQNQNQSAYAPVQQQAPAQTNQQWGAQQNVQPQQQDQSNQQWNQTQQGSMHPTPPPQTQGWNTPQQQQPQPQQSYNQPVQAGNTQTWQAQNPGQANNNQNYAQNQFPQKEGQPNMPSSQGSFTSVTSPYQEPVSPLSHRQSMSFGRSSVDQGVKRVDSHGLGRKPVGSPASSIRESVSKPTPAATTQASTTTGASALGFGGPSDWEHFGAGVEEIDDTAHFGASSTQRPSSPQANISELPSNPSPPPSIPVANDDRPGPATEGWPTPPAPAPANLNRPSSRPPSTLQQTQQVDRFQPTPPPADSRVLGSQSNKPTADDGRSNTPVQRWGHQSIPNSRPGSTASGAQPWQKPTSSGAADPTPSSGNRNTIADNSGWMSPEQPTQEYRTDGNLEQRMKSSAPQATGPQQSYVMDHGPVSPELPANTAHELMNSQAKTRHPEPIESFSLDNGIVLNQSQQQPPLREETSRPAEPPKASDLIPDLDPWYARSLERYVEMLRKEAVASAVEDKISIFKSFLAAESQERGITYYHDPPTTIVAPMEPSDPAHLETGFQKEPETSSKQPVQKPESLVLSTSDEPITMVNVVEQYSPGGRPIMGSRAGATRDQSIPRSDHPETRENPSVHIDYPSDEVAKPVPLFNGAEAPRKESPANVTYTPYRHNATQSDSTQSAILTPASSAADEPVKVVPAANIAMDLPPPDLPGFKPYTPAGVETIVPVTRNASIEVHTRSTSANKRHTEDLFFTQEEPKSEPKPSLPAVVTPEPPTNAKVETPAILSPQPPSPPEAPKSATPVSSKPNSVGTLEELLPPNVPTTEPLHPRLTMFDNELPKNFPPTFTFIAELSKKFETEAAAARSKNEKARRERQEAEEARTDELFNNNEISYAEIGPLEDNFKAKEANLKAQEDEVEYSEYSDKVFNEIYGRLQKEIGQLMEFRQETLGHLEHGLAGKDALQGGEDEAQPATTVHAVTTMVALHKALEERYDKVAAAIADRDKRYKKTQVQPLYAAGNIKKLKDLEKHFDSAEKNAALQTREQRAMRLKELFEMVEYNVQRSVEENLDYRHHILEAVPNSIDADARQQARETLQVLLDNSTTLMKALGEISRELCNAEFDVEVARVRARPGAVDSAIVKQVEEQGAKEVERVEKDNKERLAVLEDAWKEVETAFDEREMAKRRALDEAKRRNGIL